jgi:hypothetical protein
LLSKYKITEEFRLRFSKNHPEIVALGDAWTLGASKAFVRAKKLRSLTNPSTLSTYLDKGIWFIYANACSDPLSRAIYLPNPIFRYWSLFQKDFLKKYKKHTEMFQLPKFGKSSSDVLQSHMDDPEIFWSLGAEALKGFKERLPYPEGYDSVDKKDHPAIIQEFISNPKVDQYYVREELFELIRKL